MGRTGHWWLSAAQDASPDILLAGKGLGGGVVPVSAVMATEAVFRPLNEDPLLHSSTFAGNPLAMVAVQATLAAIEEGRYLERAQRLGGELLDALRRVSSGRFSGLRDVRGQGLLLGLEFEEAHMAADFMLELMARRVIACHSLNNSRTVRFTPPVILTPDQVAWLAAAVEESLESMALRYGGDRRMNGGSR
jgi:putrescine aminotransferase